MRRVLAWTTALLFCGCATAVADSATATLRGTAEGSPISGTASLTDTPQGLAISITVADVPPGPHGLHFHEFGECGSGGQAAGGHYNPDGATHGYLPTDGFAGAHAGDLGNLEVGPDGTGTLALTVPGLTVQRGSHPVAGHAIILHEKRDDFGQPVGNAGGRIACGVIHVQ